MFTIRDPSLSAEDRPSDSKPDQHSERNQHPPVAGDGRAVPGAQGLSHSETADGPPVSLPTDVAGNQLWLFGDTSRYIEFLLADIRTARSRIWIEVYILAADHFGRQVIEALTERAANGVEVRVMYDAVGSLGLTDDLLQPLIEAGGQVVLFGPILSNLLRWDLLTGRAFSRLNRRNHRKLVAIDDRIGYFGGMNLVDAGDPPRAQLKMLASEGWRDAHVRVIGPLVTEIALAEDRLWRRIAGRKKVFWPGWNIEQDLSSRGDLARLYDSFPAIAFRRPQRLLVPLIRKAKRRIVVAMAYFVPLGPVLKELVDARRRGVEIDVIVPGRSDVIVVQAATRYFYRQLLNWGIRIHERQDRMLHSKLLVVDEEWTVVGSCNLDPRSFLYNLEIMGLFRSTAFCRAATQLVQDDLDQSVAITAEHCRSQSWLWRLFDRLAWSLRRWL